jgi:hypothetical protein
MTECLVIFQCAQRVVPFYFLHRWPWGNNRCWEIKATTKWKVKNNKE